MLCLVMLPMTDQRCQCIWCANQFIHLFQVNSELRADWLQNLDDFFREQLGLGKVRWFRHLSLRQIRNTSRHAIPIGCPDAVTPTWELNLPRDNTAGLDDGKDSVLCGAHGLPRVRRVIS